MLPAVMLLLLVSMVRGPSMNSVLAEGEKVGDAAAEGGCEGGCDGVPEVALGIVDVGDHDLEDEAGNRLEDIVQRERGVVVVELEAQDLLRVRVDGRVLEAPEETHHVPDVNAEIGPFDEHDGYNAHDDDE